jgi:hypothetical protein
MSVFQVVDGYFFIKKEFMSIIDMALHHYEVLVSNRCSTDIIELQINSWIRSTAENDLDIMDSKSNYQRLKLMDPVCNDIATFKFVYHDSFIVNQCLLLIQKLIDNYPNDGDILKKALLNLLPIIRLLCEIQSISIISWHFCKKT